MYYQWYCTYLMFSCFSLFLYISTLMLKHICVRIFYQLCLNYSKSQPHTNFGGISGNSVVPMFLYLWFQHSWVQFSRLILLMFQKTKHCLSFERVWAVNSSTINNGDIPFRAQTNGPGPRLRWNVPNSIIFACTIVTTIGKNGYFRCNPIYQNLTRWIVLIIIQM